MDERDQKLLEALLEIATEIRALRVMLVSAIAPALRDEEGKKTREGFLRTEEIGQSDTNPSPSCTPSAPPHSSPDRPL
jgi:hypothetical protein